MANNDQDREFQTTHWSLVLSSKQQLDSNVRQQSLSELCRTYWYPLFAYLRRKGHSPEDAADYVQGFFFELIDKQFLNSVSEEKGRFRWFLMSAIRRFVGKELEKQAAQKRGGSRVFFSLDVDDAEKRYQREPVDGWTAEKLFDRRWALQVIEQALAVLQTNHEKKGKLDLYNRLQSTLTGAQISQQRYEEIGTEFSISAGAVKVAALRLREKYRQTLKEIVGQTIEDPDSIEDELDQLLAALRG